MLERPAAAATESVSEMLACVMRLTLVFIAEAKKRDYLIRQRKQ
jgi:phenylpyruvate tautomerase PptA (4-oxalocrotonate tautomerase family)